MKRTAQILLVEDNSDDMELACEGFRRSPHDVKVNHVMDGAQCMNYLRKQGEYSNVCTPDLILLDLNMPVMDGREVLSEINSDEKLKHIPVVVLTTSRSNVDLLVSFKLGCNSYIVKPIDFNEFQKVVDEICSYWFNTSELPPNASYS